MQICDNGNGIQQNIADKIFHSFFTIKPRGKGTGLSLSDDTIKAHGGEIEVEEKGDEDSVFIIQMPVF